MAFTRKAPPIITMPNEPIVIDFNPISPTTLTTVASISNVAPAMTIVSKVAPLDTIALSPSAVRTIAKDVLPATATIIREPFSIVFLFLPSSFNFLKSSKELTPPA